MNVSIIFTAIPAIFCIFSLAHAMHHLSVPRLSVKCCCESHAGGIFTWRLGSFCELCLLKSSMTSSLQKSLLLYLL